MSRRRLRAPEGRIPRAIGYHLGDEGRQFRFRFVALQEAYGPFVTRHDRIEASRVASLGVQADVTMAALVEAQRKRREGRGRRPTAQQIERLSRRAGLANSDYSQALARLHEFISAKPRVPDLEAYLASKNGKTS